MRHWAAAGSDARVAARLFALFNLLAVGCRGADLLQEDRPEVGVRLLEVRDEFLLGRMIEGSKLLELGHDLLHCLGIGLHLTGRRRVFGAGAPAGGVAGLASE